MVTSAAHLHAWVVAALATCHSLVHLQFPEGAVASPKNDLPFVGDPLEMELFKLIGEFYHTTFWQDRKRGLLLLLLSSSSL